MSAAAEVLALDVVELKSAPRRAFARGFVLAQVVDCSLCESACLPGDEILMHVDGRLAHFDCGREVEGWAWP